MTAEWVSSPVLAEPSEAELMRRVAAGEEAAFRLLAERHTPALLRFTDRMLRNRAEAEEVVQEVLWRLWHQAGRFDPDRARLGTWLHAIAWRLCLDRLRRRGADLPLEAAAEAVDAAPSPLEAASHRAELAALERHLAALPDRQRAALTLFYHQEMEGPEAAAALRLDLRAFWSLLRRGRAALRARMQGS